MNKIVIGNCYKEKQEDCISLCADFKLGKEKFKMHFDVPKEYAEFICDDYSDPFVLMTIEYGMATKSDIECIQPMSEDLYYQMTNYFIPLLAENTKTFHRINLSAPTKKLVHGGGSAVGAGMSCGVDAFNNVLKYKDFPIEKFRITHCLFLNHGAMGVSEYKKSKEIFEKEKVHVTNACKALGLKVICMNTNMMELYGKIYTHRANNNEGLKTAATVYVLRKLFARFMIASTVGIDMFKFSDGDVGYFAPFTTDVMSSDVKFYIGDLDTARRIDKVKNIADNPIVQKYLHVNPVKNCGRCTYCVETMAELWAIGKLDNFKESFPINDFKKNFRRRMANYLTDDHEAEFGFPKETLVTAKENGLHLPIGTRFLSWIYYRPKHFVGKLLRMKKLR